MNDGNDNRIADFSDSVDANFAIIPAIIDFFDSKGIVKNAGSSLKPDTVSDNVQLGFFLVPLELH